MAVRLLLNAYENGTKGPDTDFSLDRESRTKIEVRFSKCDSSGTIQLIIAYHDRGGGHRVSNLILTYNRCSMRFQVNEENYFWDIFVGNSEC